MNDNDTGQRAASALRPARAFHDLNEVDVIEIIGWRGPHVVRAHAAGDRGVSVIAPRRIDGEFWTFQRQQGGVLKCHSDLIGSPSLLTESAEPMVILLPADRIDGIDVRFDGTGTAEEARDVADMCRSGYARHAESAAALGLTPAEAPGPVTETADGGLFTIIRGGRAYTVTVAPAAEEGRS